MSKMIGGSDPKLVTLSLLKMTYIVWRESTRPGLASVFNRLPFAAEAGKYSTGLSFYI